MRGEIDLDAVPVLEPMLDAVIRDTPGAFVLDLCELAFLDSSGLRLILRARALLAREDRALESVRPVPFGACPELAGALTPGTVISRLTSGQPNASAAQYERAHLPLHAKSPRNRG